MSQDALNTIDNATQDVFDAIAEFTTAVADIEAAIKGINQRATKAVEEAIDQQFDPAVKQTVLDNSSTIVEAVFTALANLGLSSS